MAKKKTTKTPKPSKKTTPAVEPQAAKEPASRDANRVFAIRVTDAELDALHKAAGPRNATRSVRALVAAFVAKDVAAFRAVVDAASQA